MKKVVEFARLTRGQHREAFYEAIRLIKFSDVDANTGILINLDGVPIYSSPCILNWLGVHCLEQAEELIHNRRHTPEMQMARQMKAEGRPSYRAIVPSWDGATELFIEVHGKTATGNDHELRVLLVKLLDVYELAPSLRGGVNG